MSEFWVKIRTALLWLFRGLVLLTIAFTIEGTLEQTSNALFDRPVLVDNQGYTTFGAQLSLDSEGGLGWRRVISVYPGWSAAKAGLQNGDLVRFDTPWGNKIAWQPGEQVPLTVERDGRRFETTVEVLPIPEYGGFGRSAVLAGALQRWAVVAFSLLLLIRGRDNRAATMLGLVLLVVVNGSSLAWLPHLATLPIYLLFAIVLPFVTYWFLCFAMEISGGPTSERQARLVNWLGAAFIAVGWVFAMIELFAIPNPLNATGWRVGSIVINQLTGYAIIAWNYRRNDRETRNRIKVVLGAFGTILLGTIVQAAMRNLGLDASKQVLVYLPTLTVTLGLLAYAVLKQRLFDFGFAVNRTLVFGALSFVLLATFGLMEWGAEKFVPEAWHEGGPFISAGVALVLFLSFHRIRDWIERHVERLFFSSWHRAEASLRRFVGSAGHFERVEALCGDFVGELERFSGGALAALYLRDDSGGYALLAGEVPEASQTYDTDGRAFAMMRAERQPLDLVTADHPLPGALALPMLDQGNLIGFVLLGEKPDRAQYRPDEVTNLGWAAHQVGLDLRALHARLLERRVEDLAGENRLISKERDQLATLLGRYSAQG